MPTLTHAATSRLLLPLVALLVASGCAPHPGGAGASLASAGGIPPAEQRQLFLRLCASCHGREGHGDGPLADDLRVSPADLSRLSARHGGVFPRDLVRDALTGTRPVRGHGPPDMPVWAERLASSDSPALVAVALERARLVTGLVDHLETLQRDD